MPSAKQGPFWIFGSGTFALEVYENAAIQGLEVLGILDHDSANFLLFKDIEIRVHRISELQDFVDAPVYLAICNPYADLNAIDAKLKSISKDVDVRSPVELVALFDKYSKKIERYWLTSDTGIYEKSKAKISKVRELLADETSKNLLESIINYRTNGNLGDIPVSEPVADQYLPRGIETPPNKMNIIEFGSCGGENLSEFLKRGIEITGGFTFEPDLANFQKMRSKLDQLEVDQLTALPLAAWSETKLLRFNSSSSTDSAISSEGEDIVQASCLDDLLPKSFEINYIKMDIEGAELEALKGSVGAIQKNKPHLAVCVYHTPEHIWEIPIWINEKFPNVYNFYLRTYAEQTFETVLYAVPV